eukprot:CAMPEP_0119520646 /NCGR_PEP_ID=MMETSP1344-20130328/36612_1 /TAXON_ID=236787 /ORGANISM="Florenciella parvula, Strain CCMP2471" /LENGTH=112 /DNA_ID=CAMNT_0007558559 /DNA_START=255 /DNA_END=589 /DNA_ORIENTATION=+
MVHTALGPLRGSTSDRRDWSSDSLHQSVATRLKELGALSSSGREMSAWTACAALALQPPAVLELPQRSTQRLHPLIVSSFPQRWSAGRVATDTGGGFSRPQLHVHGERGCSA